MTERMRDMVERYGECCKQTVAARILGRSGATVRQMLIDGRLQWACGGTMVDVRSIAEYIEQPAKIDADTRLHKRQAKSGVSCRFSV